MSKTVDPFLDYVFELSNDKFANLKEVVNLGIDSDCYGVTTYEDVAIIRKKTCMPKIWKW